MRKLGIIGGASWSSTAMYYEQINRGVAQRLGGLHSARLVIESLDFEADWAQLTQFACNMLELRSRSGEPLIALSTAALNSLRPDQRSTLERLGGALVDSPIPTIEAVGGGGVRCMLAEVHLPRRTA